MNTFLKDKKIIIGITGSIAAFKIPLLVRELIRHRVIVNVVMTPSATQFVTPLILANLSRNPVIVEMFDPEQQTKGAWHIDLANVCDAMLIAPCSAATLGRLANGILDTALTTLATAIPRNIPLIIAPAMDTNMWLHPSTQRNIERLKSDRAIIIPPASGELSSGMEGPGRLPEVDELFDFLCNILNPDIKKNSEIKEQKPVTKNDITVTKIKEESNEGHIKELIEKPSLTLQESVEQDKWTSEFEFHKLKNKGQNSNTEYLKGKKVLITAGPTYEKLDDVRFIGNFSSGKMGFALAEEAQLAGADVVLITGPVDLIEPAGIRRINVTSAEEMYQAVMAEFEKSDITVMAAAVADFTPSKKYDGKIKKASTDESLTIELVPTKDILTSCGKIKKTGQKLIGFALESADELENARKKLQEKNCDMIVLNTTNQPQNVFGSDNNSITLLTKNGEVKSYPELTKQNCSKIILQKAVEL
ncbi:MAG: Bifunctional phosphopantothenoylcysteine decarboxylase/phosphopantothenate synthase [Ignavibacteria bacterium]|nr:Bifunctional phosphopantothenoylcysteine decarboxylase/phosphopantothenate synthase [Ignavibacteria bacterium]